MPGPGLRPGQWAAGLLAVATVAAALRGREGGLRTHWPALALATLSAGTGWQKISWAVSPSHVVGLIGPSQ